MRIEYSDVICLDKMPVEWAARKLAKEEFYRKYDGVEELGMVLYGLTVYAKVLGFENVEETAKQLLFDLLWELENRRVERVRMVEELTMEWEFRGVDNETEC